METTNKRTLMTNTKRLLKDFDRWRMVAGFKPLYFVDCLDSYFLPLLENPIHWNYTEIGKQAPRIVNDIIKAINQINDKRCRAILIMAYICPIEHPSSWTKWQNQDIMKHLSIASTTYYNAKQKALIEFARLFHNGWLIEYTNKELSNQKKLVK